MKKFMSLLVSMLFAGIANADGVIKIVGGEVAVTPPTRISASMANGAMTIILTGVVGTDDKAVQITPTPVPDGSVVCMKANGFHQSADWRGGHVLGKIAMTAEACSWGRGTVQGGKVTLTTVGDKACPAGRTEAAGIMSGVVQMPDGKQAWIPHPAQYRVYSASGKDATGIHFNCSSGRVAPLAADQAKAMAKLF